MLRIPVPNHHHHLLHLQNHSGGVDEILSIVSGDPSGPSESDRQGSVLGNTSWGSESSSVVGQIPGPSSTLQVLVDRQPPLGMLP